MSNELGDNKVVQYQDFNAKFSNLTLDSATFNLNTVSAWIFALAEGTPGGTRHILKSSTGTTSSGDFIVSTGDRYVSVAVRASEIGNRQGGFFVQLTAVSSGRRIPCEPMRLTVTPGISTSGV